MTTMASETTLDQGEDFNQEPAPKPKATKPARAAKPSAKAKPKPAKKASKKAPAKPVKKPAAKKAKKETGAPREGSKTAEIIALLKRKGGATTRELMKATGWQPHSVRGFLSGTLRKKMGLDVKSVKTEEGSSYSL
jgi:outer membrane biosynthesis protein TonB